MDDLINTLYVSSVPEPELRHAIGSTFAWGAQLHDDEILYAHSKPSDASFALKIKYRRHEIVAIEIGPDLKPSDVQAVKERIERDCLNSQIPQVAKGFFFASKAVNGHFKFRDVFQILPAPTNAPRPPTVHGHHPFVLEARIAGSHDFVLKGVRRRKILKETELALSVLLRPPVEQLGQPDHRWVQHPGSSGIWNIEYAQDAYEVTGFSYYQDDFTSSDAFDPLPVVAELQYYGSRYFAEDWLEIPDSLERDLTYVTRLDGDRRLRFMAACFWLRHSQRVWLESQSAAYVALISAIESLSESPSTFARCECCPDCSRNIAPGPTASFIDFVEKYVPQEEFERTRRELYALRSAISHGGFLLHRDVDVAFAGMHPDYGAQRTTHSEALLTARLVILRWLADIAGGNPA